MSGMTDEDIERLIKAQELKARARHTITDPHWLKREVEAIRKKGITLDNEEIDLGVKCVAAPIKNRSSAVVAAISLSCPAQRFTPTAIGRFEKHLRQASLEISCTLGVCTGIGHGGVALFYAGAAACVPVCGRTAWAASVRQFGLDRR